MKILNSKQKKSVKQLQDLTGKYGSTRDDAVTLVNIAEHLKKQDDEESRRSRSRQKVSRKFSQPMVFNHVNFYFIF